MADFQQVAPQNLEAIFSQNPGVWGMAQDYMNRANQGNDLSQQHQQLQNSFDQQAQPFKLAQLGLQNQTAEAQLPGLQANSRMQTRKDSNEAELNPQVLQELKGKYSSAELKRHMDDIEGIGNIFSQSASSVAANPLVGRAALKAKLEQSGHGDMYNPAWDNLQGADLFNALDTAGKQIQMTSGKYRTGLGLLEQKGENSADVAKINAASREAVANSRNDALKAMQAAKGSSDPKTVEGAMVKAMAHADATDNPEEKAAFMKAAQAYQQQLFALKAAGANATAAGKVDVPAVAGMPAVAPVAPPPLGGAPVQPTPTAAPKTGLQYKSAQGQDWVKRALAANPGMSEEDIIMQGRKSGKLID